MKRHGYSDPPATSEPTVKERPIIFSAPMVRAILAGKKTQTRRIIKPQPTRRAFCSDEEMREHLFHNVYGTKGTPYGALYESGGDKIWVRETWADVNSEEGPSLLYRADGALRCWREFSDTFGPDYGAGPSMDYAAYPGDYTMWWSDLWNGEPDHKWKPSIHMPRWASRITLEIIDVRCQRLQDISESDASDEGVEAIENPPDYDEADPCDDEEYSYRAAFAALWNSIHGEGAWDANPWCWAITFKQIGE